MPQAYTMQVTDAERWIRERYKVGMTEIHIVNGLNPDLDFDYYPALLRMIRREFPALHIKAFTAVEIHYFAQRYKMSYEAVLGALMEAGLASLPGAELRSLPSGCVIRSVAIKLTQMSGLRCTALHMRLA